MHPILRSSIGFITVQSCCLNPDLLMVKSPGLMAKSSFFMDTSFCVQFDPDVWWLKALFFLSLFNLTSCCQLGGAEEFGQSDAAFQSGSSVEPLAPNDETKG